MTLSEKLPDGYEFDSDVIGEEVVHLRDAGEWGTERDATLWDRVIDESIATVGVRRISNKELVGIGFLAGNARHAVLCDFIRASRPPTAGYRHRYFQPAHEHCRGDGHPLPVHRTVAHQPPSSSRYHRAGL